MQTPSPYSRDNRIKREKQPDSRTSLQLSLDPPPTEFSLLAIEITHTYRIRFSCKDHLLPPSPSWHSPSPPWPLIQPDANQTWPQLMDPNYPLPAADTAGLSIPFRTHQGHFSPKVSPQLVPLHIHEPGLQNSLAGPGSTHTIDGPQEFISNCGTFELGNWPLTDAHTGIDTGSTLNLEEFKDFSIPQWLDSDPHRFNQLFSEPAQLQPPQGSLVDKAELSSCYAPSLDFVAQGLENRASSSTYDFNVPEAQASTHQSYPGGLANQYSSMTPQASNGDGWAFDLSQQPASISPAANLNERGPHSTSMEDSQHIGTGTSAVFPKLGVLTALESSKESEMLSATFNLYTGDKSCIVMFMVVQTTEEEVTLDWEN
ncbi:hypothetical protein PVAG01_05339 [Phlyctema vagabunda]|uniref:Uncharacterized protein n=1 Tax=Phlyctema vagabunda TaxID=108571 RepID=A0ABR4PKH5_9HELO